MMGRRPLPARHTVRPGKCSGVVEFVCKGILADVCVKAEGEDEADDGLCK